MLKGRNQDYQIADYAQESSDQLHHQSDLEDLCEEQGHLDQDQRTAAYWAPWNPCHTFLIDCDGGSDDHDQIQEISCDDCDEPGHLREDDELLMGCRCLI